ncbi:hypothetical protein HDC90_002516 [Pedobacter sp. AK013]|nr:hypothetical protein [Pedobacter sp. AK013]
MNNDNQHQDTSCWDLKAFNIIALDKFRLIEMLKEHNK